MANSPTTCFTTVELPWHGDYLWNFVNQPDENYNT